MGEANCGPGSKPEPALQGQVPLSDRESGRSKKVWCNLELVGQYQGEGASWQTAWYEHCAYYGTAFPSTQESRGVQVLDVSNPAKPKLTENLTTTGMLGPWESLKVNEKRGLLAGIAGWGRAGNGGVFFDVYDVKKDCAHPKLLSTTPLPTGGAVNAFGHEGTWAPDGKTYYASGAYGGFAAAIDVTDPSLPSVITTFTHTCLSHGFSTSTDGKTLYATSIGGLLGGPRSCPLLGGPDDPANGLQIIDVSQIQAREPAPLTSVVGSVYWNDGSTAQHTIPITKEIAYFNPPAQMGHNDELAGSEHASLSRGADLSTDWCTAQVRFLKDQLWTTCQDNGFLVLRFTRDVLPFGKSWKGAPTASG